MPEQRTFHGEIGPEDFARALIAEFHHGPYQVQQVGDAHNLIVQIASSQLPASGGRTALTVHLTRIEDGVMVNLGQQEWIGLAASLGLTALTALRNPLSLLGRLDDLAQDITSLQLPERVWATIERTAEGAGASFQLSERLRRLACEYCLTANPVGAPSCVACGAPLGLSQPIACSKCGYVSPPGTRQCPNCKAALP
jgi:RNA polymerase subunit RPABC4/transcription elongation factor Spt4